jgi:glyoxalase family protein
MCGDPTENADFYVNKLGLRLVKKTVNHDAPTVYHLFYGDRKGTPGSSITFFPNITDRERVTGANQVTELGLRIPEDSIQYWKERLENLDIEYDEEEFHGKNTLKLEDPDGLPLRLYPEDSEDFETWEESDVDEEHQIRGMSHIVITVTSADSTRSLLEEVGLQEESESWYKAEDGSKVEVRESDETGREGKGTVHHIAFKVRDEEQEPIREKIKSLGFRPSPLISRKYFTSFYFRESNNVLFEFSNLEPGYTADESVSVRHLLENLPLSDHPFPPQPNNPVQYNSFKTLN